jgi:hypothetical protein
LKALETAKTTHLHLGHAKFVLFFVIFRKTRGSTLEYILYLESTWTCGSSRSCCTLYISSIYKRLSFLKSILVESQFVIEFK